uniref:FCH and mu domain containing endocytic adaptor 1 n=1 Tax=Monodelphis domestica TaxID=13616 RepID=K7E2V9_MONDO
DMVKGFEFWPSASHLKELGVSHWEKEKVQVLHLFCHSRATVEEAYSKAMAKLAKMAGNGTPMGTFAPLWEVFRVSSDKLALCHMELTKKLNDLIKDVARYGEEQSKAHKKCKEEAVGTLEAVQALHGVSQLLPKSRESYVSRCLELERLRKEGTNQKEIDKVEGKTKKAAETLRRCVEKYNTARGDFERKMLESALVWKHGRVGSPKASALPRSAQGGAEQERKPARGRSRRSRALAGPRGGVVFRPRPPAVSGSLISGAGEGGGLCPRGLPRALIHLFSQTCPVVDEEGFSVRPDVNQNNILPPNSRFCSSSDSDYDDDEEPRKFFVQIKPAPPPSQSRDPEAAAAQLKATAGSLILPPGPGGTMKRHSSRKCRVSCAEKPQSDVQLSKALFGPPLESALEPEDFPGSGSYGFTSSPSPFSSSSPENVEDSGLDSPSHPAPGPSPDSWVPRPSTPQSPPGARRPPSSPPARPHTCPAWTAPGGPPGPEPNPDPWARLREGLAALPRRGHTKKTPSALTRSNGDLSRSLSPSPLSSSVPSSLPERSSGFSQSGISRGPSPVVLGSQDALPVATAFTEYIHAYFRGQDAPSCMVKVTGELTMSFPAGIVRVFSGTMPLPVLSFRLVRTAVIEHFQPNTDLLFSDPSQSDPATKDFWLNMSALTGHLQRQAEQSPAASYYNVVLLRYQFSKPGAQAAPLQLSARWQCGRAQTQVSVEYSYCPSAMALPSPLTNVQILLPVEEPVTNVRLQPARTEERVLGWGSLPLSPPGPGHLSASWEPLSGPSMPGPVAAHFTSEGSTLSGVDVELVGSGYRIWLLNRPVLLPLWPWFCTWVPLVGAAPPPSHHTLPTLDQVNFKQTLRGPEPLQGGCSVD